jgi:hypothetical protein
MSLLRLLILSSQHRLNSAAICGRGMSQFILLNNTTIIKQGIEYGTDKHISRAIYSCIFLIMEVERGRFYLIDLYLMVIWCVVCVVRVTDMKYTYGMAVWALKE